MVNARWMAYPTSAMAGIHILHVEDDPDDVFLVWRTFQKAQPGWVIHSVRDASQAMDYLRGLNHYADRHRYPLPRLLLLDLQLAGGNGFDLLAWVRRQEQFNTMPVVVLSGSVLEDDERCARELGANAFFAKSPLFTDCVEFIIRLLSTVGAENAGDLVPVAPPGSAEGAPSVSFALR